MKKKASILSPLLVLSLAFLLILSPSLSFAQETAVQGIVTDEVGKPVKDARVTLVDPERGLKFVLKTDKNGTFIKVGIPPTTYKVTIESEGFLTLESEARIRFGMTEKLEAKLKKLSSVPKNDRDMAQGSNFYGSGRWDEAIERFKKVIEKYPSVYEGYYSLGLSYLKKKEVDLAVTALEKAAEINHQSVESCFALGEAYFAKGESEKALESFSRAIALNLESPLAHYNLGLVFYKLGKNEEALAAFEKAVALKPDNASAHYQAGLAAIRLQSFDKALKSFQEFLRLEPNAQEAGQVRTMIEELKKQIK